MAAKTAEEKVLAKLEKFGINQTGGTEDITPLTGKETLEELEAILEKAEESAKPKKVSKLSVSVEHSGGVREFSKEVHGDDFEDKAKEFAETNKGTIL